MIKRNITYGFVIMSHIDLGQTLETFLFAFHSKEKTVPTNSKLYIYIYI